MMRRVPVDMLPPEGEEILLMGEEALHLRDVLRAKSGDRVVLFNGRGGEGEALIVQITKQGVSLKILNRQEGLLPSPLFLAVGIALLKENKVDELIRPLTELGVRSIRIYQADRSVPSPNADKMEKKLARWNKLAVEAMKQCGVSHFPEIFFHRSLFAFLEESRGEREQKKAKGIVFWENTKTSAWPDSEEEFHGIHAVFGPEGGFSEKEVAALLHADFLPLGLGPRILRAPTAILAGTALLQYRYGDLSLPPTGFHQD